MKTFNKLPISNMQDIYKIGESIAVSNIFDRINKEIGVLIASHCFQHNISLVDFANDYNVAQGKITKNAHTMVADFMNAGGSSNIITRTGDKCKITLKIGEQSLTDTISWEEIKDESYTRDKMGNIKTNYSTVRRRKQMLYVRLISDMIRVIAPNVSRDYTSEEIDEIPNNESLEAENVPTRVPLEPLKVEEEVDEEFLTCPIKGSLLGRKWADFSIEHLKKAQTIKHPDITDKHRLGILQEIKKRALSEEKDEL